MGNEKTVRCASCHRSIDLNSQYCKHCGYQIKTLRGRESTCRKCGKPVEGIATYCVHCGYDLQKRTGKEHQGVRVLKYLASVILVILILIVFFTILYKQEERRTIEEQPPEVKESFIDITSLTCEERNNLFTVCGTFAWSGLPGDYVTVHVPGTTQEESAPFTSPAFDYCGPSGSDGGFRIVRMVLRNSAGDTIDEVGRGVDCKSIVREPATPPSQRRITTADKKGNFRIERTTTYKRGFGTLAFNFDGPVESCEYDGTYLVDDSPLLRNAGRCNNARGSFSGSADARRQFVVDDPEIFAWDYNLKEDPQPRTVDNYFFSMRPCEVGYSQDEESINFARTRLSGFGTSSLLLSWEFKDDSADRAVDVFYTLRCKFRSSSP